MSAPGADEFPEGQEKAPPGTLLMAVLRWVLLGLVGASAAYTLYLPTPVRPLGVLLPARDAGDHEEAHVRYHCAMHPQIVSDEPGTCPICGMKLTPIPGTSPSIAAVDGGALQGLMALDLPVESLQQLGVRLDVVRTQSVTHGVRAFGRLAVDESRLTRIHLRVAGYVEQLFVSAQGAKVSAGEPLAAIHSDELLRLEGELLQAKKWNGDTTPVRERLRLLGVAEKEIAEVEASGRPQQTFTLRSPASGFVTAIGVAQGDRIDPETELFEVADLSRVWLIADVPERDVGRLKTGLATTLTLGAYPGQSFKGKLDFIYPTVKPETRSLSVRVTFSSKDGLLKPGLSGRVEIEPPARSELTVATEAVIDTGERRYVFVQTRPGRYEPRMVVLGERESGRVEVLQGLLEGETVAASGNFFIDSESKLRASTAALTARQP